MPVSRACEAPAPWERVHARLCAIARTRSALDHEELQLIREAIEHAIWRRFGMTSIREYLEHVMGHSPKVASERVRVAEALHAMPALEGALGRGELPYSAVREITRIATNKTEEAWLRACRGKNLREIEDLLAEREPGDWPESPRKPDLRAKDMRFRGVKPATRAKLRTARQRLEAELGERLDDDDLLSLFADRIIGGEGPRARAATQVAVSVCPDCQVARQHAAGRDIALRPEELERALCDAEWIDVAGVKRANQDVTPAVRKQVRLRDHDRCCVPGCRAAMHIDVHHIVPRAHGGSHDPENLLLLCGGHHDALHAGELRIHGTATAAVFERRVPILHVENEPPRLASSSANLHVENDFPEHESASANLHGENEPARADAMLALTTLGFSKSEARQAVDGAVEALKDSFTLEQLIREALRRCPKPI